MSCAETYKTLSGHRHFSKATDDIGSWLPQLRAAPRPEEARSSVPFSMSSQTEKEGNSGAGSAVEAPYGLDSASAYGIHKGTNVKICDSAVEAAERVSWDRECRYGRIYAADY